MRHPWRWRWILSFRGGYLLMPSGNGYRPHFSGARARRHPAADRAFRTARQRHYMEQQRAGDRRVSGPALAGFLLAASGSRIVYVAQIVCATLTLLCFASIPLAETNPSACARAASVSRRAALSVRAQTDPSRGHPRHVRSPVWRSRGPAPIFAVDILHAGARRLGLLRAAPSVGAVLMASLWRIHGGSFRPVGR